VAAGAYPNCEAAQQKMIGLRPRAFQPNPQAHAVYKQLYALYRKLHDAFGTNDWSGNLFDVMKELIEIRGRVRT